MTVDRYTKAVLTVIALCLIWIAIRPVVTPAYATPPGQYTDVNIAAIGAYPVIPSAALPVKVQ